ncbi:hypothetical protein PLESTM_001946400 [Pleodorina starrii]|nr:hypothetical protein PLESTM_001946400 [Pleodorina starrii]
MSSCEVVLRPTGSTQRLVASTSARCAAAAAAARPWRRAVLRSSRYSPSTSSFCPNALNTARARGPLSAGAIPMAAASSSSSEDALADDALLLDDQDAVAAAEAGGRNYLQLSDMSDASLQVRMVQWYPGHIARAERQLKSQLSMVDVVLEVRDARIPVSTHHPQVASWVGAKPRLLLMNRADEVDPADLAAWRQHYRAQGQRVYWTDGRSGDGVKGVRKELLKVAAELNAKRAKRGLQPRPVRACVIGFPNIGKSALINRLVNRRAVASAPKPGVTRQLRWVRVDEQLDLLDAPGVIPASFRDQLAAQRLAMCNDIGEAAYLASAVAAAMVVRVKQLAAAEAAAAEVAATAAAANAAAAAVEPPTPTPGSRKGTKAAAVAAPGVVGGVMSGVLATMTRRYGVDPRTVGSAEDFIVALAARLFGGDLERAGIRLLTDYRNGALGRFALELPADLERRERREAGLQAAAVRRERERQGAEQSGSGGDSGLVPGPGGEGEMTSAGPFPAAAAAAAVGGPYGGGVPVSGWGGAVEERVPEENSSWVQQAEAWALSVQQQQEGGKQ